MVKFADFSRQYAEIKESIDTAVHRVLDSGWYVLGQEVESFEREFAEALEVEFAVSCANGTDALILSLMALGAGPGDEVITVPNTAIPTAMAISRTGALPRFVDIDPQTLMMNADQLEATITPKTKVIIPVHLFGNAADMKKVLSVAGKHGIPVIEDCAQAQNTRYEGRNVGTLGTLGTFSFYPSKNLGAYGDGGMIITNSHELHEKLILLRNYGQTRRYVHVTQGMNSRLDEIQAAILRAKLPHLLNWNERRRVLAARYTEGLRDLPVQTPVTTDGTVAVFHLYVIRTDKREELQSYLQERGVQTLIHYPIPIHLQEAYESIGHAKGDFPIAEAAAEQIVSLPMWPELTEAEVDYVCEQIRNFFGR